MTKAGARSVAPLVSLCLYFMVKIVELVFDSNARVIVF